MSNHDSPFALFAKDAVELNMLTMKSKLLIIIASLIKNNGWGQKDAAKELGISQPRVSNLMNGQVSKFSIDFLIEVLCRLGFSFNVKFQPHNTEHPLRIDIEKAVV